MVNFTEIKSDERSKELLVGYAVAAQELAHQLTDNGIQISPERPLVVYLPCGWRNAWRSYIRSTYDFWRDGFCCIC